MSSFNCCFLTHIQVSQETDNVVWYSHIFKTLPVSGDPHSRDFSIVSEAAVDIFLEFPCFFNDPADVGILISGSSAFFKHSLNIWKFSVYILLKLSLKNFEHNPAGLWKHNFMLVCTFFVIALLWDWNENWPLLVLWPLQNFPNLLAYWVQHLTASSFRILNSSAGILSSPLVLFIVIFLKAYFTLQDVWL